MMTDRKPVGPRSYWEAPVFGVGARAGLLAAPRAAVVVVPAVRRVRVAGSRSAAVIPSGYHHESLAVAGRFSPRCGRPARRPRRAGQGVGEQVGAGATGARAPCAAQIAGVGGEQVQLVDALGLTQRAEPIADRISGFDPIEILEEPGAACEHQVAVVLVVQQGEGSAPAARRGPSVAHREVDAGHRPDADPEVLL